MDFRREIFTLCKELQKIEAVSQLKEIVRMCSIVDETELENGEHVINNQGRLDFGYVSKHDNTQFYGYLYTNENLPKYSTLFPNIEGFNEEETAIFRRGHATILRLIELCLEDLKKDFPEIYNAINPYSKFKPINIGEEEPLVDDTFYENAVKSFKDTQIMKKINTVDVLEAFNTVAAEHMITVVGLLEKELTEGPLENIPTDIENFLRKTDAGYSDLSEVFMAVTVLLVAIRLMLSAACQLMFIALIGEEFSVYNNDNIISVEKNKSNMLYKTIVILCTGAFEHLKSSGPGNIVLVDCDPSIDFHMHEFCFVYSCTMSMNLEMGSTTQYTLITADEELNMIHNLTNSILEKEFPPVIRQESLPKTGKKKKVGRNDPCPCGSGLKYKKCCGK